MDLVDYTVLQVMLAVLRALSAPGLWAAAVVSSLDLGVVDDGFRITALTIFATSAVVLSLSYRQTFAEVNFGTIAMILAMLTAGRVVAAPLMEPAHTVPLHQRIKRGLAEYVVMVASVASAIAMGYQTASRTRIKDPEAVAMQPADQVSDPEPVSTNSRSASIRSLGSGASNPWDTISEAPSICYKHMGPPSETSSRSGAGRSTLSLSPIFSSLRLSTMEPQSVGKDSEHSNRPDQLPPLVARTPSSDQSDYMEK